MPAVKRGAEEDWGRGAGGDDQNEDSLHLPRRIEIALLPEVDVDIRLELDRGARLERDRRRLQGRPRGPHA